MVPDIDLPDGGDGDPYFPGGIGCEFCNTLWATDKSVTLHERDAHGIRPEHDCGRYPYLHVGLCVACEIMEDEA
jgi:hypothetical protein